MSGNRNAGAAFGAVIEVRSTESTRHNQVRFLRATVTFRERIARLLSAFLNSEP
ncbi:MAG: hypothetical protein AAF311_16810 [Pseudomonadota bacterium]